MVDQPNLTLALIERLILLLSLSAGLLRRDIYVVSEPMVAVAFDVLIGLIGVGLLDLSHWGDPLSIIEQVARLTMVPCSRSARTEFRRSASRSPTSRRRPAHALVPVRTSVEREPPSPLSNSPRSSPSPHRRSAPTPPRTAFVSPRAGRAGRS